MFNLGEKSLTYTITAHVHTHTHNLIEWGRGELRGVTEEGEQTYPIFFQKANQ